MSKTTLTSHTIDYLQKQGCQLVQNVETWNFFARKRKDLFGCWDVLAVRGTETIAVQVTSRSNISSRLRKISDADSTPHLRKAKWTLLIHGWDRQQDGRMRLKEVNVS